MNSLSRLDKTRPGPDPDIWTAGLLLKEVSGLCSVVTFCALPIHLRVAWSNGVIQRNFGCRVQHPL